MPKIFRNRNLWFCLAGFLFIASLLTYNFFVNLKCSRYPWWHEFNNDSDGTYVAQTLALINGEKLHYIHHPGGTVFAIHGLVYRTLAAVYPKYSLLTQIKRAPHMGAVFALLDMATSVSRIVLWVLLLIFVAVAMGIFYQFGLRPWLVFFFTLAIGTTPATMQYMVKIRPELLSVLFSMVAFWLILILRKYPGLGTFRQGLGLAFIGASLTWAILAKIQILPVILALLIYLGFVVYRRPEKERRIPARGLNFVIALLNVILFPWWAVRCPGFITDSYLQAMPSFSDYRRVYGDAPQSFGLLFLFILVLLCLISLWGLLHRNLEGKGWVGVPQSLNGVILGSIFALYLVFLPVSTTWSQYLANTNHLIYATVTNISGRGFLLHPLTHPNLFKAIAEMHCHESILGTANILVWVALSTLVSFGRLVLPSEKQRQGYAAVLIFFAVGFMMDMLSFMRSPQGFDGIFGYYAIYSFPFYIFGLALWAEREWGNTRSRMWQITFRIALVILFGIYAVGQTRGLLTSAKASGVSDQTPMRELQNSISHAPSFWGSVGRQID